MGSNVTLSSFWYKMDHYVLFLREENTLHLREKKTNIIRKERKKERKKERRYNTICHVFIGCFNWIEESEKEEKQKE